MNLGENNITSGCQSIVTNSSSALLNLTSNQVIQNAYLYWAGSGSGDFNVKLNTVSITAERTFSNVNTFSGLNYFSAFADVTSQIISSGNGTYTLSDLDISQALADEPGFCDFRTNFAGWTLIIVYKDTNLPLNQINIYDGFESIPNTVTINLTNLNVIDNVDAKIGFVAWEGDANLAVNETLKINGTTLSNLPLNPANNAFNGTNTITGSASLFNMDLDIYNIQNNIAIGDTSAQIELTSGQDVVLINVVITKLNSQLPDATITSNNIIQTCDSKSIVVEYTVSNTNCTNSLPSGTPIAFYSNDQLIGQTQTNTIIPIDGTESRQITLSIPNTIPNTFIIKLVVDDNGSNNGIVTELLENNNSFTQTISLWESPKFNALEPLLSCNEGFTQGTFNFSSYENLVKQLTTDTVRFYNSEIDAQNQNNEINNISNFTTTITPKEIFIRIENEHCFSITSFLLKTHNCPPTIYNYISANNDGMNDTFYIDGLRNVFLNFELEIYNRWGRLIWTGNAKTENWDGYINKGFKLDTSISPKGTYYYILNLNDAEYTKPICGWLYFTK
jgi:gliding motility-associated-like protein